MENGIITLSPYRFYPLELRADLRRPECQAILRTHHKRPRTVFCACGADADRLFPLVVREEGGDLYIARDDISEHAVGCFLRRSGDAFAREVVRTSALFGLHASHPAGWKGRTGTDGAGSRYEDYASYVRRVLSLAVTDAWVAVNRARLTARETLTMPSAANVLSSVDAVVRKLAFRDAPDGYAAAALTGARFRFGFVLHDLLQSDAAVPASVTWWNADRFEHELVVLPHEALRPALSDLTVFERPQQPPYLIVAVIEPNGTVRKMFLHQVYFDGTHLVFVESSYESRFAAECLRQRVSFLKPIREDEIDRALRDLGLDNPLGAAWRYRPDFLVFSADAIDRAKVIEVRGFKPGTNQSYDARLEAKMNHYDKVCHDAGWEAHCVEGWRIPRAADACFSALWGNASTFISPSAAIVMLAG